MTKQEEMVIEEAEPSASETLREIHEHMAEIERKRQLHNEDPDKPEIPEEIGASVLKYHKQAEISGKHEEQFDTDVAFYGSHVVNSNTKRVDNLRHLGELSSTNIVRHIPYLRQRGTFTKVHTTSEFQMCRSNPEIGGFDQKIGRTNITKEDVDMKQQQTITGKEKARGGILGFLRPGNKA